MSCIVIDGNKPGKEDNLYEFTQDIVQKWFKNGRYGRIGTIGDGSCFFHSVCKALDIKDYNTQTNSERRKIAHDLRCGLSKTFSQKDYDLIVNTIPGPSKTFDEIKKQLCEPSVWAEEVMIKWSSMALDVNIIFLDLGNNKNTVYCGVHNAKNIHNTSSFVPTIVVAWVDHSHFELVVRIDDVGPHEATIRRVFDPETKEDLETIENLMMAYKTKCKL